MAVRSMAAVCLAGQAMGGTPLESIEGVRIWDTPAIIQKPSICHLWYKKSAQHRPESKRHPTHVSY